MDLSQLGAESNAAWLADRADGRLSFEDELAAQDVSHPSAHTDLTPREREVLEALARGMSNEEIATELVISEKTVKTHLGSIFGKLQVDGRAQAMLYAIREGLVEV